MKNIIGYLIDEKRPLSKNQFGAVDSLVLSQMAYLKFDGLVADLSEVKSAVSIQKIAGRDMDTLFRNVPENDKNRKLFAAFVNSPRFCDTRLAFYVNHTDDKLEKQFSAISFLLSDDSVYLAFRGTDSSFIGWKEDFNMAFTSPVPSQKEGTDYVNAIAGSFSSRLRIGGHSKGGNIAVYSAIYCDPSVQDRIDQIYSHDGPGFRNEILQGDGYLRVKDRINKTLPQSSIIGMLLQQQEEYAVVKSNRFLLMQHDPYSWLIDGSDFNYLPSISKSANYINGTIDQWMNSYDDQERELFINTLFQILQTTEAKSFHDLSGEWYKRAGAAVTAMREIDEDTKAFLRQTIGSLVRLAIKNLRETKPGK